MVVDPGEEGDETGLLAVTNWGVLAAGLGAKVSGMWEAPDFHHIIRDQLGRLRREGWTNRSNVGYTKNIWRPSPA